MQKQDVARTGALPKGTGLDYSVSYRVSSCAALIINEIIETDKDTPLKSQHDSASH